MLVAVSLFFFVRSLISILAYERFPGGFWYSWQELLNMATSANSNRGLMEEGILSSF